MMNSMTTSPQDLLTREEIESWRIFFERWSKLRKVGGPDGLILCRMSELYLDTLADSKTPSVANDARTDFAQQQADKLYGMKIGETQEIGPYTFNRVAGGWIYLSIRGMVFVPFNNEFQKATIDEFLPF